MIPRRIEQDIKERLEHMPGVVLLGPRQVGKTTLARALVESRGGKAVYLDLEDEADRALLADPRPWLETQFGKLVVIDEVQRAPDLFSSLRGVIDERRRAGERAGHFLLLGSANRLLLNQSAESLAGRVAYLDIGPIDAAEARLAGLEDLNTLWVRGGFPDSLLAPDDSESFRRRIDLIRTYIERDLPFMVPRLPSAMIGRLWTMLAHNQGALFNASQLASSLAISAPTVTHYVDILCDLGLVRRLNPWFANVGKRLVKSPRYYVRDSGLLHTLLRLETLEDVLSHPVAGASWEGMVIDNIAGAAGDRYEPYFYRTTNGAEIDLVLVRGGTPEIAIEVKRSSAPTVERGFHLACDDLGIDKRWLIYPRDKAYPKPHGIIAMPLVDALAQVSGDWRDIGNGSSFHS
jgi:predicted AAA+ superfamily ATPase